jgi:catechol 2,3-dioxygenase-like lactoylglutathione lyase family enzyme
MPITTINHFFIRADDLQKTRDFFVNVLGLSEQARPDFPFPGYWLGTNGGIQVHIGPSRIPNRETYYLGTPADAVDGQTGVIDHVAFLAEDPHQFVRHLQAMNVPFRPRYFPEFKLYQLFLRDPNGVMIELNFNGIEDAPDWGGEDYGAMARVEEIKN